MLNYNPSVCPLAKPKTGAKRKRCLRGAKPLFLISSPSLTKGGG